MRFEAPNPKAWTNGAAAATPSTAAHVVDQRLVEELALIAAEVRAEQLHALDLGVDVLVDLREQVVEHLVERVGEHERPRHERHAEHDGDDGRDQPALVLPERSERDPPHVRPRRAA